MQNISMKYLLYPKFYDKRLNPDRSTEPSLCLFMLHLTVYPSPLDFFFLGVGDYDISNGWIIVRNFASWKVVLVESFPWEKTVKDIIVYQDVYTLMYTRVYRCRSEINH